MASRIVGRSFFPHNEPVSLIVPLSRFLCQLSPPPCTGQTNIVCSARNIRVSLLGTKINCRLMRRRRRKRKTKSEQSHAYSVAECSQEQKEEGRRGHNVIREKKKVVHSGHMPRRLFRGAFIRSSRYSRHHCRWQKEREDTNCFSFFFLPTYIQLSRRWRQPAADPRPHPRRPRSSNSSSNSSSSSSRPTR